MSKSSKQTNFSRRRAQTLRGNELRMLRAKEISNSNSARCMEQLRQLEKITGDLHHSQKSKMDAVFDKMTSIIEGISPVDKSEVDAIIAQYTHHPVFPTIPKTDRRSLHSSSKVKVATQFGGSKRPSKGTSGASAPVKYVEDSHKTSLERRLHKVRQDAIVLKEQEEEEKIISEFEEIGSDKFECYLSSFYEMDKLWKIGLSLKYLITLYPLNTRLEDIMTIFDKMFIENFDEDWLKCLKDDETLPDINFLTDVFFNLDEDIIKSLSSYPIFELYEKKDYIEYIIKYDIDFKNSIESLLICHYFIKLKYSDKDDMKMQLTNLNTLLYYIIYNHW